MAALAPDFLDDIAREEAQTDLDICIAVRRQYRHRLLAMEREGRLTSAWRQKFDRQIDALTDWIGRYRERLA